jgi:outer membrane protein assembly factor BamD
MLSWLVKINISVNDDKNSFTMHAIPFVRWNLKTMKAIKYYIFTLCAFLFCLLVGCANTTDPSEAYKNESAEQIFQHGEKAMRDKSYREAIKRFEALDVQYPFGHNTEIAQLQIIYAYHMVGDYALAEAAAGRFIHAHPTNPNVDYAYYMRGLSNYFQNLGVFEKVFAVDLATRDLSQIKKSYTDFSELVTRFPNSRYAPAAHQYMVYLRNMMANHELQVAQYYYKRGAYVAAANRATDVVRHYQGAPVVPDGLVVMVKSYRALHLTKNEQEAMVVLQYNYPDSKYVKDALNK